MMWCFMTVCLPSPYMGGLETIYLIAAFLIDGAAETFIVEPVMFCFIVYCAA